MIRSGLIFVMILLLLIVTLAGCGGIGAIATEYPPLMLPTVTNLNLSGRCDNTSELESWWQGVTLRQQEFWGYVETAIGKSPDTLYPDVARMGVLIGQLNLMPVPDCAEAVHQTILDAMLTTAQVFQAYVNEERDDLAQIVTDAQAVQTDVEAMLLPFRERLQQQYEN